MLEMCGFDMIQRFNRKKFQRRLHFHREMTCLLVWVFVCLTERDGERLSVMEPHGFTAIFSFWLSNFEVWVKTLN